MIIMDNLLPERPVLTWVHNMKHAVPTQVSLEQLGFSKCKPQLKNTHKNQTNSFHLGRVIIFSPESQCASMVEFVYSNQPQQR